jgi:hypothetical protein
MTRFKYSLVVAALAGAAAAQAQTVNSATAPAVGVPTFREDIGPFEAYGMQFSIGQNATLLSWTAQGKHPGDLSFSLYDLSATSGSLTPTTGATTIYSTATASVATDPNTGYGTATFSPGVQLTANTSYFAQITYSGSAFSEIAGSDVATGPQTFSSSGLVFTEGAGSLFAFQQNTWYPFVDSGQLPRTFAYAATFDNVQPIAAVPEPSAYAMAFAGLAVLGWGARRRQAAKPAQAA